MDSTYLEELLEEVKKRGGGLVLNEGEKPAAVVLSVDSYQRLMNGVGAILEEAEDKMQPTLTNKTVLVTGGAGYVGAHTVRELLLAGFSPVVVDNLSYGKRVHVPEGVPFYEGDISDVNFLRDVFNQHAITAVAHFAASLEVAESVEKPLWYFEANALNTAQLLKVMDEFGVREIIFSSTAAVYGEPEVVPIPETATCLPNNPYGASKLYAEGVLKYFSEWAGFRVTVLRYFNVCGAVGEWNIADTHLHSHLIPIILEVAAGEREKIVVNGGDYQTTDGSCIRDYVHVRDIARAHVAALSGKNLESFAIYNVGTGHGSSVKEMISSAAEVTERMIPMEVGPRRPGDAAITIADSTKIRTELGFSLQYSDLDTIFRSSWELMRKNSKLQAPNHK